LKRTFSILLILIIIFNFLGAFLTFIFIQKSIKKEVKRFVINNLPDDKLTYFIFPKSEIEQKKLGVIWIHSKEFKYNNRMYDIVRIEKIDDNIKYIVFDDSKETDLVNNYLENSGTNNLLANNPKLKQIKLFKFDHLPDKLINIESNFSIIKNFNLINLEYLFKFKPDLFKPPKIAVL